MSRALALANNKEVKYFVTSCFSYSSQYLRSMSLCFWLWTVGGSSNISVNTPLDLQSSLFNHFESKGLGPFHLVVSIRPSLYSLWRIRKYPPKKNLGVISKKVISSSATLNTHLASPAATFSLILISSVTIHVFL